MQFIKRLLLLAMALLVIAGVAAAVSWQKPPPRGAHDDHLLAGLTASNATAEGLSVSWWGVSAILISDGQTRLFIDPYFSRPEGVLRMLRNAPIAPDEARIRAGLQAAGATALDAVLVSHSHHDHAMDAGVVARETGALLLGSESTLNIGRGAGLPESRLRRMDQDQPLRIGEFTIRFRRSAHAGATGGQPTGDIVAPLHTPARYLDYRQGGTWSIHLDHPRHRFLHHGSAGWRDDALRGLQADTVLLGVALVDDWERYLHQTVDAVAATRVIPVHWDDFTRPFGRDVRPMPWVVDLPEAFATLASRRPALGIHTLPAGQPVHWPPLAATTP